MKLRLALFFALLSCSDKNTSNTFSEPVKLGVIDSRLPEASGIASSVANPGYIWAHNDGQNPAEIFLIDTTAHVKMICKLPVDNRDWEEIAVGPGPEANKSYVYVGEIGDNTANHDLKYIYRFEEPKADTTVKDIVTYDTLKVQMSDGKRDTETMMIDPFSNDLYLISKREDNVGVYRVRQPFTSEIMTAEKVGTIPYFKIVAGSFSPDGLEVILKDYDHIYYWKRAKDESLEQVLARKAEQLPYDREAQGEALTWKLDGSGYYTLSETNLNKPATLRFYKRN